MSCCPRFITSGASRRPAPWLALALALTALSPPLASGSPPPAPGALDVSFPAAFDSNAVVHALLQQPDGSTLVGGAFSNAFGLPRRGLVRLRADGTLDPAFDISTNFSGGFSVFALARQSDGKIIVGGALGSPTFVDRGFLRRFHPNGAADSTWGYVDFVTATAVYALAVRADNKVYYGGNFFGGVGRRDANGYYDSSFLGISSGIGNFGNAVFALAVQSDNKLLVGGQFTIATGAPRNHLLRVGPDGGSADASFSGLGASDPVYALSVQGDGKILAGGAFTNLNGSSVARIARLQSFGSPDKLFLPTNGPNGTVRSVQLLSCGKVVIGGSFTSIGPTARAGLARLNPDGTLDGAYDPGSGFDGAVLALAERDDGKILAGGNFLTANQTPRPALARMHSDPLEVPVLGVTPLNPNLPAGSNFTIFVATGFGTSCLPWRNAQWRLNGTNLPGVTGATLAVANARVSDAGTYTVTIANETGSVTSAPVVVTVGLAALDSGALDLDFYAPALGSNYLRALALQPDGNLLVGGAVANPIAPVPGKVARLLRDGRSDASFVAPAIDRLVRALAVQPDGRILVGGEFTTVGGSNRPALARLQTNGALDEVFAPVIGSTANGAFINRIVLEPDGHLWIVGQFASVNGQARYHVARLAPDGRVEPALAVDPGVTSFIYDLVRQPDGRVIVGGVFNSINGVSRSRVARLQPDGVVDPSFNNGQGFNGTVRALALQPDGKVIVAGDFSSFNQDFRLRVARLNADGTLDAGFDPGAGANNSIYALALRPDGKLYASGAFNSMGGIPRSGLARLLPGGGLDTGFNPGTGANGTVLALLLEESGRLWLGGDFTRMNGFVRPGLARVLGDTVVFNETRAGGIFRATVATITGRRYTLEYKNALTDATWTTAAALVGTGAHETLTDAQAPEPDRFYRVRID